MRIALGAGRDITLWTKVCLYSQSCGFSCSHVQMWEFGHKEGWAPKNWCFHTVELEKTLESPLNCKEIQPVNQPWTLIGGTDAEAEAPILWPDAKSRLTGKDPDTGGEGGNRGWDGCMASPSLSKHRETVKDRGAWHPAVPGVTKSQTQLSNWTKATMIKIHWGKTIRHRRSYKVNQGVKPVSKRRKESKLCPVPESLMLRQLINCAL